MVCGTPKQANQSYEPMHESDVIIKRGWDLGCKVPWATVLLNIHSALGRVSLHLGVRRSVDETVMA